MASAITHATQTAPPAVTQTPAPAKAAATSQKPVQQTPATPKDTVRISSAAQSALQESQETRAQTAKEASAGDHQAQRLVAKQAVVKKA